MPKLSPEEIAAKYGRNAGAASSEYVQGVQRVTEHPGRRAVQNRAGYEAGVRENVDKWAARTGNYSLEEWKQSAEEASSNYSSGVQNKGVRKQEAFWREFGPHLDNVTQRVRAMPGATPQDREARMLAQVRGTREFRRRAR
jgi:hypothetical protein